MVVQCSSHKTAHAYGAAKHTLDEKFFHILELYSKHIRPKIETHRTSWLLLQEGNTEITHTTYKNYTRIMILGSCPQQPK